MVIIMSVSYLACEPTPPQCGRVQERISSMHGIAQRISIYFNLAHDQVEKKKMVKTKMKMKMMKNK